MGRISQYFLTHIFHLSSYGIVYKGTLNDSTVAIKKYNTFLPSNDTEAQNFFNFRNEFIVDFRGICCSLNALILEYCRYGSVQSWFKKGRLTEELKLLICWDCAKGMKVCLIFKLLFDLIRYCFCISYSQLDYSLIILSSFMQIKSFIEI